MTFGTYVAKQEDQLEQKRADPQKKKKKRRPIDASTQVQLKIRIQEGPLVCQKWGSREKEEKLGLERVARQLNYEVS